MDLIHFLTLKSYCESRRKQQIRFMKRAPVRVKDGRAQHTLSSSHHDHAPLSSAVTSDL